MNFVSEITARLTPPFPDHDRFTGPPFEIAGMTPDELGRVWPLLHAAQSDPEARTARAFANDVLAQADTLGLRPRLDTASLLATLRIRAGREASLRWTADQLSCLVEPPSPAVRALVAELVPPPDWRISDRFTLLAMLHQADDQETLAQLRAFVAAVLGETLAQREFTLIDGLGADARAAMAGHHGYYQASGSWADHYPDPAPRLADMAEYVAFAREILHVAADRVDAIHAGTIPYVADGAFNLEDAHLLARGARVAALRDEPWLGDVILRLLPQVSVAPTAAKSLPSQALAVALGHSIEGAPTPEGVAALRLALQRVRHAGIQKKLARNLKPAERALAQRPAVALRMAAADIDTKQHRAMLTALFEASFISPLTLPYGEWRARLLGAAPAAVFARELVWQADRSFVLDAHDNPVDIDGAPLALENDTPVSLWHPVAAHAQERQQWRARFVERRLRQPLRQVFREYYQPDDVDGTECTLFEGWELSAVPLIGLARREGWALNEGLVRRFGPYRVTFEVSSRLFPGCQGAVPSAKVTFGLNGALMPLRGVPARIFSEACRAVDLLVSVSAMALESDRSDEREGRVNKLMDLSRQAGVNAMRRHALETILRPHIDAGIVTITARHVHAGGAAVHLRTGRVMRDGTPIELALPPAKNKLAAVPWLPYDEAVLERVVRSVGVLITGETS